MNEEKHSKNFHKFLIEDGIKLGKEQAKKESIESVKELWMFLQEDLWYAIKNELKTEEQMLKYINTHFRICLNSIEEELKKEVKGT